MLSNKVHTLIVIHFLYLLHLSSAYEVLNSFYGSINAGDVNYYTLESTTPVIIALYSIEGDADMYGSPTSKNSKPSSESSDYMSTSCGLDVMILPMSKQVKKMSVGIYGHVRHQNTSYHLSVIAPKDDDILRYQVWEQDPETMVDQLVIDVDPLVLVNDPNLHELLDTLYGSDQGVIRTQTGASDMIKKVLEWVGFVLLKIVEIGVEILL